MVQYLIIQYSVVLPQLVQYLHSVPLHSSLESLGFYHYTPPGGYLEELLMCKHDSPLILNGPSVPQPLLLIVLDPPVDTLSTALLAS